MQNRDMIIRPTDPYLEIEDLVTPELFFDLMEWAKCPMVTVIIEN